MLFSERTLSWCVIMKASLLTGVSSLSSLKNKRKLCSIFLMLLLILIVREFYIFKITPLVFKITLSMKITCHIACQHGYAKHMPESAILDFSCPCTRHSLHYAKTAMIFHEHAMSISAWEEFWLIVRLSTFVS